MYLYVWTSSNPATSIGLPLGGTPPLDFLAAVLSHSTQRNTPNPIMPGKFDTTDIRYIRLPYQQDESFASPPSTDAGKSTCDLEVGGKTIDHYDGGNGRVLAQSAHGQIFLDDLTSVLQPLSSQTPSWARRKRIPFIGRWLGCGRRASVSSADQPIRRRRTPRALRVILKSLAIALMLL